MGQDDPIVVAENLADGNDLIVDGSNTTTGAIDVNELGGDAAADVYREVDTNQTGAFDTSVLIDQPTSNWHSQKNLLEVSKAAGVRLRINNTSGGSAYYYVSGYEVPDAVFTPNVGTIMFVPSDGGQVYRYDVGTSYDISTASYTGESLDVSADTTNLFSVTFNRTGSKLVLAMFGTPELKEYTLGTSYAISTASLNQTVDINQTGTPYEFAWNGDGSQAYVISDGTVYQYTATDFNLGTISFDASADVSAETTTARGMSFDDTGEALYITDIDGANVYSYPLSTAFDVTTLGSATSFDTSTQEASPDGITWSDDGTQLFISGAGGAAIYEYAAGTAFDITTLTFTQSFDVSGETSTPVGVEFDTKPYY